MTADEEWTLELAGETEVGLKPHDVLPIIGGRGEIQALLAPSSLSEYQLQALRTLYRSGMRPRELGHLNLLDDGSLEVCGRRVAVDEETFRALKQLPTPFKEGEEELNQWVAIAAQAAGLLDRYRGTGRKLSASLLRHSYACHQLEQGMDLFTLSQLMGHEHFWTTSIYKQTAVRLLQPQYQAAHPLSDRPTLRLADHRHLTAPPDDEDTREHPQAKLSDEETFTLIQSARNYLEMVVLRTLYSTALRKSELPALRYADLEVSERRLFVRQGKDSIDRYVLLDPCTVAYLIEIRGHKTMADPIFDLTSQGVGRAVGYAAQTSGLLAKYQPLGQAVSTHALRHAFASHTYARGMHIYNIQQLLGHSNLNNTLIYVNCPIDLQAAQYAHTHELARPHFPRFA